MSRSIRIAIKICALMLMLFGVTWSAANASDDLTTSGNWTNSANWSLGHVPSADDVKISGGRTATYTGGGPTVSGFIWTGDGAAGSLTINSGSLTNTAGFGNFGFTVGIFGGSGQVTLGAGAGTLSVVPLIVGRENNSVGTITQNGGTVLVSDFMSMGLFGTGGTSTYNMNGGTLSVAGDTTVNETRSTVCTFNQTGGTVLLHNVYVGRSGTGGGQYLISGGTLSTSGGDLRIGSGNSGANGTLSVSGTGYVAVNGAFALTIGNVNGATGTVNQTGGQVVVDPASTFGVWLGNGGDAAKGVYNLNGGTLTTGRITPEANNSVKAFNFGGGSLKASGGFSVSNRNNFTTAINAGGATFDTAGFDVTWLPDLSGAGSLNKVGAGTLAVSNAIYTGLTTVSAGTLTVNGRMNTTGGATVNGGTLRVVNAYTNAATVSLAGGTLVVSGGPYLVGGITAGQDGTNVINGGTLTVGGDRFIVGAGANGYVNMTNGALSVVNFTIGQDGGTGTLIQSNGTVTASGFTSFGLGSTPGTGSARYEIYGGTLTANGDFSLNESKNQTCIFTQAAGTVVLNGLASGLKEIGRSTTGTGQYDISGGLLSNSVGVLFVGANNNGILNISGTASVINQSNLVVARSGTGTVNIAAGSLQTRSLEIGRSTGAGIVTQNNGGVVVQDFFTMGTRGSSGSGSYVMNGGSLTIGGDFSVNESNSTTSTFRQSGGTVTINGDATHVRIIGRSPLGQGVYNISGGVLNNGDAHDLLVGGGNSGANGELDVSGTAVVNIGQTAASIIALTIGGDTSGTTGTVNQTGGTVMIQTNSTFGVWLGPGGGTSKATYNLNGGTLVTPKLTADAGTAVKQFNFGGGTLQATNNFTVVSAPNFTSTINSGGGTIDTAAFTINWNTPLGGSGALAKNGSGVLSLNSNNTYTGITFVNAGTLQLGNGGAGGSAGTDNITNNSDLAFNRSDSATIANLIAGSGRVEQNGSGTSVLTVNNTYGGVTLVNAGTLQIGAGGAVGALGSANVTNNSNLSFNRSDSVTLANLIAGTGRLVQSGSGTLILAANNTYSGVTLINAGTLQIGAGGTSGAIGAGNVTNNADFAFNRTDTVTFNNLIAGTGRLEQNGTGTVGLTANNTYSGGTTVNDGTLLVNNTAGSGTGSGLVQVNAGATLSGTGSVAGAVNIAASGSMTPTAGGTLTMSSSLINAGSIGASGGNFIVGGVFTNSGTALFSGGIGTLTGAAAVNTGTGLIQGNGTIANTAMLRNSGTIFADNASPLRIGGALFNQAGGVVKATDGRLIVTGVFTNSGTLTFLNSVGTFSSAVVNNGAWVTDPTTNVFQNTYTLTSSGSISMSAGDVYIFTNGASTVGSFINNSTQSNTTSMLDGKFVFDSTLSLTQKFATAGDNIGSLDTDGGFNTVTVPTLNPDLLAQYSNNFALGSLQLSGISTTEVFDSSIVGGRSHGGLEAALFLTNLVLDPGTFLVISNNVQVYFISSNGFNQAQVFLDGNAGLHQLVLAQVVTIPEPTVILLWLSGAATLYYSRRRRTSKKI